MHNDKTRLMAVTGATLALIVAGTTAVAARPGDDGRRPGFGGGDHRIERGFFGDRGAMRGLRGGLGDIERREVTIQTADGTTSDRVEQGTVTSATDTALDFTLASGEAVSVVIDQDTGAFELTEQAAVGRKGAARQRLVPSQIEVTSIEPGSDVVVWSEAENGADFVARRVVVQPSAAETTDSESDTSTDADTGGSDAAAVPSAPASDA